MKASRHLFVLLVLIQAALFTGTASAGTINNPDIIVNGQLETFSTNVDINWYTFSLVGDGNILVSGKTSGGGSVRYVEIYDSNLTQVGNLNLDPTDTENLIAGDYYLQAADNEGGTFRFSSTQLIPGSGAPSPDYTAGYNAGYDEGQLDCEDDPASCGIEPGGEFYVIPFPVPAE